MIVSSKTFMELVERITRMEMEHALHVKRLEERIEVLERRPIVAPSEGSKASALSAERLYEEMMYGVKDETTGRVVYTDGRE